MKLFVLFLVLIVLTGDPVIGLRGALFRLGRSIPGAEIAPQVLLIHPYHETPQGFQGFLRFERSIMPGRERRGDSDEEESGRFG